MPRPKIIPGLDPEVDKLQATEKTRQRNQRQKIEKQLVLDDPELRAGYEAAQKRKELWRKYCTPDVPYDPDLGAAILDMIASGLSLKRACEQEGMPACSIIYKWITRHKEFGDNYARAVLAKAQVWADEITDIADDSRNDWELVYDKEGNACYKFNSDHVKRQQLRIDTRKWYLSKVLPKQFGDATLLKLADAEGNKLPSMAPTLIVRGIAPKVKPTEEG